MTRKNKHILTLKLADLDRLHLPLDRHAGGGSAVQTAIADYVRRQFAALGGVVQTISVDDREIQMTWLPGDDDPAPVAAVVTLLQKGQYPEGMLLMELLLSDSPDDAGLIYNLGMAYSDTGELDYALSHLRRLIELEPDYANGRIALGLALMRNGDTDQAVIELRRAAEIDPSNPWAHRNLGASLMNLGRADEGVVHLRKAAELNPTDDKAWYGLGQALETVGDDGGADRAFIEVLDIDEHSEIAELARQARTKLAQRTFRAKTPATERMDAVMYCLGALQRFAPLASAEVQKIGFEIAILGRQGLDVNDSTRKYQLRSLPGEFTGLHLMCIMYVAFKQVAPEQDIGFDLSAEYKLALEMNERKQ